MEERNRNKRFRIESVYYESSMLEPMIIVKNNTCGFSRQVEQL